MSTFTRDGWSAAALAAAGVACTPHATPGPATSPQPAEQASAAATRLEPGDQRLRGVVIVGKDGFGFTPCGSEQQRIARFSPQAQMAIDRHLDQGGALEFFIEGRATVEGDRLLVDALDRIDDDTSECERAGA